MHPANSSPIMARYWRAHDRSVQLIALTMPKQGRFNLVTKVKARRPKHRLLRIKLMNGKGIRTDSNLN
jgi:hypothetical protein